MVWSVTCGRSLQNFHSHTVHLDIIKVFYLPTDAQEFWFKSNIKIYIKTAPTCFGVITIIRECGRSLMMVITPKHVGAALM